MVELLGGLVAWGLRGLGVWWEGSVRKIPRKVLQEAGRRVGGGGGEFDKTEFEASDLFWIARKRVGTA